MKVLALILGLLTMVLFSRAEARPLPPVEIPFDFSDGFVVIQAEIQKGVSVNLLVDSGAGASILDLRTARKIRARMGREEGVRGVNSESVAFHIAPLKAKAAGVVLTEIQMAMDLSRADELCSQPIHGLLGMDFFAERVVQIDYAARKLRLLDQEAPAKHNGQVLPIRELGGVMCVPVAVNGSNPRWTRLDTGCNDAIHWVVPQRRTARKNRGVSVGFITDEHTKSLTSVRLGQENFDHVTTALHSQALFPGEAGLLGNGLLSRHVVTIDNIRGWLHLQTVEKPSGAAKLAGTGSPR